MSDLIEEIKNNPEFVQNAKPLSPTAIRLMQRMEMIELQIEAMQLIFRATGVFSEKLFQEAIKYVVDMMEKCAKEKTVIDEDFFVQNAADFRSNMVHLGLINDSKGNP